MFYYFKNKKENKVTERTSTIMESMGQMMPMEGTNKERLVGPTCEKVFL